MGELQIDFQEADLERPSPQRMQWVYEAFAEIFLGYTSETFEASISACEGEMDHFKLFQDSIGLIAYYQQLARLMIEVGIDDFEIRDLIRPDPEKVRRILSAVINLAKFREERQPVFEGYLQKSEDVAAKHRDLQRQVKDLKAKLENLRVRRAEEEPQIRSAQEENSNITNELRDLKRQQTEMRNEVDALKRDRNELTEKLTSNQYVIINTKQEAQRIQSRIVQSPNKLKRSLTEMGSSLLNARSSAAGMEKQARLVQSQIDSAAILDGDINVCIDILESCESDIARLEVERAKLFRAKEEKERRNIEVREVEVREEQLVRQLEHAEGRLRKAHEQAAQRREEAHRRLSDIREKYALMANERTVRSNNMAKKRQEIEQIERKVSFLKNPPPTPQVLLLLLFW